MSGCGFEYSFDNNITVNSALQHNTLFFIIQSLTAILSTRKIPIKRQLGENQAPKVRHILLSTK